MSNGCNSVRNFPGRLDSNFHFLIMMMMIIIIAMMVLTILSTHHEPTSVLWALHILCLISTSTLRGRHFHWHKDYAIRSKFHRAETRIPFWQLPSPGSFDLCIFLWGPAPSQLFGVGRAVKKEAVLVFQGWLTSLIEGFFPNNLETRETWRLSMQLRGSLTFLTPPSYTVLPKCPPSLTSPAMKLLLYLAQSCAQRPSVQPGVPLSLWSFKTAISWNIALDNGKWVSVSLRDHIYIAIFSSHGKRNLKQL